MSSKRFKKILELASAESNTFDQLISKVKKNCTTKFDESIDLNLQINHKQKKNEINLRTVFNLPEGTGKKIKVAVVCEESKIKEAKDAGADIAGADEFIEKIKSGQLNFDKLIPKVKKNCTVKFDESIDLNLQINNKQKKNEINLRTVLNLPAGTIKKLKLL